MNIYSENTHTKPVKDSGNRSERTRTRLLTAACRIFAEKGYYNATIADICGQAKANVAAINYHFGDKETLYLETWRYAFGREIVKFSGNGGVSEYAPPEERLAGLIRILIQHMTDEQSYSFAIMHNEMTHPTNLLNNILLYEINPKRRQMLHLIRECFDFTVSEQALYYCQSSIIGQCFQWLHLKRIKQSGLKFESNLEIMDVEAFSEHVVQFSLAGIRAVRASLNPSTLQ